MFWEEASDVQHRLVKNSILRNRFVAILQNFHLSDNITLDATKKYGKVSLLLDMVRDNLRIHAKLMKYLNIDETNFNNHVISNADDNITFKGMGD